MSEPRPPDPLIGTKLAERFRILSLIATGGQSRVYRAEQIPLGREVAVKVLSVPHGTEGQEFRERFFKEAALSAKLTHPNTVRIFEHGEANGQCFIAMELLKGVPLKDLISAGEPMPAWRAIEILLQVCGGLQSAHNEGLIHRDLKPSNLLVSSPSRGQDFVRILDFGLAKDTRGEGSIVSQTNTLVGSPRYMSPEQIEGRPVTPRTDIYALGVVLFEMLTANAVFAQSSTMGLLNCHLNVEPRMFRDVAPNHDLSASLEWVTMTCLKKDPSERFATAAELAKALRACRLELRGAASDLRLSIENGHLVLPMGLVELLSDTADPGASVSVTGGVMPMSTAGGGGRGPLPFVVAGVLIVLAIVLCGSYSMFGGGGGGDEPPAPVEGDLGAALAPAGVDTEAGVGTEAGQDSEAEPETDTEAQVQPDAAQEPTPAPAVVSPRPRPRPRPRPAPAPAPAPPPALVPVAAPAPAPVTPAPSDDWGTPEPDLIDPWDNE